MTNKEKQYIKELGQLYVQDGYEHLACGGMYGAKYKPVDVIQYVEEQEYNENLNTYMKYRTAQRYSREVTCGGNIYMSESSNGNYVKNDSGTYINISDLERHLKPEDIQKRIQKLTSTKYKGLTRYSVIIIKDGNYPAYVENPDGNFIIKDGRFIDITKQD